MNVLDLFAKLSLDSSEYDKGLEGAKSKASSIGGVIGKGLSTVGKVAGVALGVATTAVGAFAKSSIDAGMSFDSAMSQVQATMLKTDEEMQNSIGHSSTAFGEFEGNLREFAQFLGQNTAFSATEAAEALNYMALAGYSVQESMDMLPNVLSLASAGNFDLARASDMVTDAQTAFGINAERTTQMVDEMAKAASTGNTSVEQLGDAFLVVGGLAKELNGGMVTLADGTQKPVDGLQEMEIALTAMANAGVKGSEAGTHMRNMLLKLSSPTDAGTKALEEMGVTVFDTEGKMRSLADIFGDLSNELDNMTQEQKIQTISDLFNTRDMASAEALLAAVGQDWNEIGEAILDAKGSAAEMAAIQLDNLEGDITLFKSALEGAKIAISDELTPSLRDFVKFGTNGLSTLTSAFKEGGITGAMEAFGKILSEGLNMVIKMLPKAIDAGMKLLGALGQGILDNLPMIIDAAVQIINQLVQGIVTALPYLVEGALQIILGLANGISQMLPTLIPTIVDVVLQIVQTLIDNIDLLIDGALQLMIGLANGLIAALPVIIEKLPELVMGIVNALIENLPLLLNAQIQIIMALAQAIIENLPVLIDACVQIFMAIVELIVEYGGQFITAMMDALNNLVTNVNTGLSNMLNAFITWLSQLPTQMAYWAGYAIASFIQFIIELPTKIQEIFTNVITAVTTFGTNFWEKAKETAKNFFDSLVNGIQELPSRMIQFGTDLVNAIMDLPSRFMSIGSDIVNGLWQGISSGWEWLTSSVSDLANSLLQGAKDALGIASPSKKFAWVGRMVDEGFANGINAYSGLVDDAIGNVTDIADINAETNINGSGTNGTNMANNVIINVYGAQGQDEALLARQIANIVRDEVVSLGAMA